MGRGIIESGLFRAERYGLEQRTSDPGDHSEGERWIRTDLAPDTDQIATIRFDMGSEIVDVPIYDDGATVDGVEKVRKVRVGGTTGFIPFAADGASYPQWAMQHDDTRLGAHDALTASAIPDSVIDNFEEVLYEDQNKTLSDRYGGDTGLFARQQTTVQEGSYALEGTITDFEVDRVISSTSIGTVEQGDSFAVDLQWPAFDSDRGMIFRFGTADETNTPQSYGVGAYGANDWSLSYWDGSNNRTDLDTSSTDDPSNYIGEWVTAKVTWGTDDSIAVDFEDNNGSSIESLSASDASVTSGGIGFMVSVFDPNISETYYFDNVRFI